MKALLKRSTLFLAFFVLGSLFFSSTASAYIDPSAVTYIVQIIAGIIIAGGAAFAFYFRRMRRAITRKKKDDTEDYTTLEKVEYDEEFDDVPGNKPGA